MISTRGVKMSIPVRLKSHTYLLVDDLFGDVLDLVVAQVDLGEVVRFPKVLDELELVEVADLHRERCEALALHDEIARLLSALEAGLDGLLAGWSRGDVGLGSCHVLICLCSVVDVWVALGGCNHDISATT